jgi:hypothetical protein
VRIAALLVVLVVGCSSSDPALHPVSVLLDAQQDPASDVISEPGQDVVHEAEAGADAEPSPESSFELQPEAASEAAPDVVEEPACVPEYVKTDSKTGTSAGGDLVLTVELACEPSETTPQGWWLGLCEESGDVKLGCSCMHVGQTGVQCSLVTDGTATLKLTIHCLRDCGG